CPVSWRSPRRRTVPPLLLAGAVVGVQIAESILNPHQHMCDKWTLEVHLLVVTVCLIKYASIADALNLAQRVVAIGTLGCCGLFALVFRAHLGVVDAGEDVNPAPSLCLSSCVYPHTIHFDHLSPFRGLRATVAARLGPLSIGWPSSRQYSSGGSHTPKPSLSRTKSTARPSSRRSRIPEEPRHFHCLKYSCATHLLSK